MIPQPFCAFPFSPALYDRAQSGKKFSSAKVRESHLLALSASAARLTSEEASASGLPLRVFSLLLKEVQSCKTEACQLVGLRALRDGRTNGCRDRLSDRYSLIVVVYCYK